MLKRNLYKLYMKKENGRVQLAEIKKWRAIYYTRPVRYEVIIEYMTGGGKKTVTITTSSSFLKKYKDEKSIQIVTVPGTNFVFLGSDMRSLYLYRNILADRIFTGMVNGNAAGYHIFIFFVHLFETAAYSTSTDAL